ncbi:hypothetical protein NQ315_015410 [Exocentrus adspersus]|uniref:DUF7869 domain-containing protein n=1 Tax=Exocentrus adspersus TaxID=1586481 RepID=A0AAV8V5M2_9CUCU|nr:hypothetical protein NQ315_015410 [Exocentrus adspersus]
MSKQGDRSSLILKLSKRNLEVHNVDEPMWKIQRYLRDSIDNQPVDSSNKTDGLNANVANTASVLVEASIPEANGKLTYEHVIGMNNVIQECNIPFNTLFEKEDLQTKASISTSKEADSKDIDALSTQSSSDQSEPFGSGASSRDPDYEVSSSSSSAVAEAGNGNLSENANKEDKENSPAKKKGRRKTCNPMNWKKNKAKHLRNCGKSYQSLKVTRSEDGTKVKTLVTRDEKRFVPLVLIFVGLNVQIDLQKNHENFEGKRIRVCRKFFISTLGITTRTLRTVMEKQESNKTNGIIKEDFRGKHTNHVSVDISIRKGVKEHIESIPRIESHYCRADTKREFIEEIIQLCVKKKNINSASYRTYYEIFTKEFNIGFFCPRKDQCDLCTEYTNVSEEGKQVIQEKYERYQKEKELSRKEKENNCSGQNKNKFLFALYLYAVTNLPNINSVTHKYLIRGHTQNAADNVHSVIEKQISRYKRSAAIYAPDQYITLIRQAKKTGRPYEVKEMSYDDFVDLKDLSKKMGIKDAYKNENGDVVRITDIKVFEVHCWKGGDVLHKTCFIKFSIASGLKTRTVENLNLMDKPGQIFNLDETTFCHDPKKTKVVGAVGVRSTRMISSAGRENTTVLICCSANGDKLPPLVIFNWKNIIES